MASHLNGGRQGGHCQALGNKITVVAFQSAHLADGLFLSQNQLGAILE